MEITLGNRTYAINGENHLFVEVEVVSVKGDVFFFRANLYETSAYTPSSPTKWTGERKRVYATSATEAWKKVGKVSKRDATRLAESFGHTEGVELNSVWKSEIINEKEV